MAGKQQLHNVLDEFETRTSETIAKSYNSLIENAKEILRTFLQSAVNDAEIIEQSFKKDIAEIRTKLCNHVEKNNYVAVKAEINDSCLVNSSEKPSKDKCLQQNFQISQPQSNEEAKISQSQTESEDGLLLRKDSNCSTDSLQANEFGNEMNNEGYPLVSEALSPEFQNETKTVDINYTAKPLIIVTKTGKHSSFVCGQCNLVSKFRSNIVRHISRVHLLHLTNTIANTKWQCEICGKEFGLRVDFNKHMTTDHCELNEDVTSKSFACDQCHLVFGFKTNMFRHVRNVHKTNSSRIKVSCNQCNYVTKRVKNLRRHVTYMH